MIRIVLHEAKTKKRKELQKGAAEYEKRLSRIASLRRSSTRPPKHCFFFSPDGAPLSSEALSQKIQGALQGTSELHFALGSPRLWDNACPAAPHFCLTSLALPEDLSELLLLEQIYRAFQIASGTPYHK
ncbi:LSU methyltransferase RlmH [Clostridiaceae bacterium JG1575]|nr:LSU methyltransferase RlmH [Clostridiaceae bacterium JG1575]